MRTYKAFDKRYILHIKPWIPGIFLRPRHPPKDPGLEFSPGFLVLKIWVIVRVMENPTDLYQYMVLFIYYESA